MIANVKEINNNNNNNNNNINILRLQPYHVIKTVLLFLKKLRKCSSSVVKKQSFLILKN